MIPLEKTRDNRAIPIARYLQEFQGLDLNSDFTELNFTHSPDALNVYKDYKKGKALVGRPGLRNAFSATIAGETVAMISATINTKQQIVLYQKIKELNDSYTGRLVLVVPKDNIERIITNVGAYSEGLFFSFDNKVYFKNKSIYHCSKTDGSGIINGFEDVLPTATIPTTSFNRYPMGGGEDFNPVNILQPKRRNSFVGDGESTEYFLDVESLDSVNEVIVNGASVSNYTVTANEGKITFTTAPPKPDIRGQDNVIITFTKTISGYADRLLQCTLLVQYDNRIFISGNPSFPNALFNSQREDPTYIPDIFYYEDGIDTDPIVDLAVANKGLFVFKGGYDDNPTIYFHQGRIFYETDMKVYPSTQTKIQIPCKLKAFNFNSEIVYISNNGLQGVVADYNSEFYADLRSTYVLDTLKNATDIVLWKGYLLVSVGNNIYLADSKSRMETSSGLEYNWFKWEVPEKIDKMFVIGEDLYLTLKGKTYVFDDKKVTDVLGDGTEKEINQYWNTFFDHFDAPNRLKTLNKRGLIIYGKDLDLSIKTTPTAEGAYGNYVNLSFSNGYVVSKNKQKKILGISFSLKAKASKVFELHNIEYEAFVTRYAKR